MVSVAQRFLQRSANTALASAEPNNRIIQFEGEMERELVTQLPLLDINKVTLHLNSSSTCTGLVEWCRREPPWLLPPPPFSSRFVVKDPVSGVYFTPATLGNSSQCRRGNRHVLFCACILDLHNPTCVVFHPREVVPISAVPCLSFGEALGVL